MYIIAEIGTNHNGDPAVALDLIRSACTTGVQAVKMNYWEIDQLADKSSSWYERGKKLQLRIEVLYEAQDYCSLFDVDFIVAPFVTGWEALHRLATISNKFKIASGELTNRLLLNSCKALGMPSILSTGMSTMEEIRHAVSILSPETIMHCVSLYPTPYEHAGLGRIGTLRKVFPSIDIGYSDHTVGTLACVAAYSRGCSTIEKHFNLVGNKCADSELSINEDEMKTMLRDFRKIDSMYTGFLPRDMISKSKLRRGPSGLREG